MASDRVIIVRIAGIGFSANKAFPLTLTSRSLSYLQATAVEGVVTELGSQMSSEIGVFASMGSDPTTTFSVLANTQTLSVLMSRGAAEVRGSANQSVQTTQYVTPSPTPTITVTDASTLNENDIIRINGNAYRVVTSDNAIPGTLTCDMVYGSVPQPIPVRKIGEELVGSTLYASYWQGVDYSTGGAEQQAVTISTVEIDAVSAAAETVVFRGVISTVNIQTSAGTENQIQVECMSLMGVIKNAPWAPAQSPVNFQGQVGGAEYGNNNRTRLVGVLQTIVNTGAVGPLFDFTEVPFDTRAQTFQIRKGKYGGVASITFANANLVNISASPLDPDLDNLVAAGFNLYFNDGSYSSSGTIDIAFSDSALTEVRDLRRREDDEERSLSINGETVAEIAFTSSDLTTLITDLIFGTFNSDFTGSQGMRSWGMAAYIPFDSSLLLDIIDIPSLISNLPFEQMKQDLPVMNGFNYVSGFPEVMLVLPVKPDGPKTIGEVLDYLLKNLGVFMVYDKGRISFGRWASENAWPTEVNDSDFAEPKIALKFDRMNSLQSVEVGYPAIVTEAKLALTKNPIANVERIVTGAGKLMSVASMMQQAGDYQLATIQSFAFSNGTNLITRYSQAAGIIEVTLRDSEVDLAVGEYVAFSSAFIPNGAGSMGVVDATGIVLKAVRSWQTPTSSYTLFLPGYLYAANRISQVSVSGRVVISPATQVVTIELNAFTSVDARSGAPLSDPEAFAQTLQRIQSVPKNYRCALYDEYGTPYGITAKLDDVDLPDKLEFGSADFDVAVAGDIIVMEFANNAFSQTPEDLEYCWDAYQADGTGQVNADVDFAYPWSR